MTPLDRINGFHDVPRSDSSADEHERNRQTTALIGVAANALVARTVARLQTTPGDADQHARLDDMKREVHDAAAELTAPGAERELYRFACRALRLNLVCPRVACRKAQGCRGNAQACFRRAAVPGPVSDFVTRLMLAERLPWMSAGASHERLAYQCWIAAIEARR